MELLNCKGCGRRGFKSVKALAGHQRWCKDWKALKADKKASKERERYTPAPTEPHPPETAAETPQPAPEVEAAVSPPLAEGEPMYPPLEDWTKATVSSEASGPLPGVAVGAQPAVFDSSGIWQGIGAAIDGSLLKDKKVKVDVTEAKAKLLDGSIKNMGILVQAPPAPIQIAYWMPFMVTMLSIFVLPLVLAYMPDLLKNIKLPVWKKKEKLPVEPEQKVKGGE